MTAADWRADVLRFWFALTDAQWWNGGPDLDHRIKERFLKLWAAKRQLPVDSFLDDPLTALARCQFFIKALIDRLARNLQGEMVGSELVG